MAENKLFVLDETLETIKSTETPAPKLADLIRVEKVWNNDAIGKKRNIRIDLAEAPVRAVVGNFVLYNDEDALKHIIRCLMMRLI